MCDDKNNCIHAFPRLRNFSSFTEKTAENPFFLVCGETKRVVEKLCKQKRRMKYD